MTDISKRAPIRRGRRHTMAEVQELARKHTKLAIDTLAEIARNSDKEAVRIAAATALLERGWGKAMAAGPGKADAEDASFEVVTGIDRSEDDAVPQA